MVPFRPIRSVSVHVPTWQGEEFLGRLLAALAGQRFDLPWDLTVIDSGSRDRTLAILAEAAKDFPVPLRVRSIHQVEFDHGDTRNLLATHTAGDLLVYLTQDAIPLGEGWLAALVAHFDAPEVAAAYCRNVPRSDARPATVVLSADDPGYAEQGARVTLPAPEVYARLSPHEKRLLYNFNDVASAVRREVWERHPFPRTPFGEDVLMARALLEAGWAIDYAADAPVEHSHDYDAEETYRRAVVDGRFNVEWLERVCVGSSKDVRTLVQRFAEPDRRAVERMGLGDGARRAALEELAARREAAFRGLFEGGREALQEGRTRPATRVLDKAQLSILFVVHGFPPDTWAGTEVYTLELAKALVERGHRVTVLTRAPAAREEAEGGPEEYSILEDSFEGLRVLRLVHRLRLASLRESYAHPRIEARVREVLLAEQPDVVHFQHLIHLSAGLVHVARELGIATLVHCHDYWALCARVQLIRPDGVRCEENQGAGCLLCVKERHLAQIPRVAKLGRAARPLLDALAERALVGDRPSRGRRRWEGYRDVVERQPEVLAAFGAADLLVSPSRFLRAKLLESGAFDPHAFVYSDNGLRTDHVRALEKRPDPKGRVRFGFVGSLVWYKGGETLVRAMARLAGTPAVLHVHGAFDPANDPHHAELKRLAEAAGNVEFHGRFDNSRLGEVYAEIDVLVVPSIWFENSPITIHEAYLTRTPVVASDIGGMAEYVRDGVDGLHFRTGDDGDLARVLARFLPGAEGSPDRPAGQALIEALSRDFMHIKTARENALESEFRYRGLVARLRPRGAAVLLERRGAESAAREGAAEVQGADLLLLRPGAAAEYDVAPAAGGERELELEVLALGGEGAVPLGGRVLLGHDEVLSVPTFRAGANDELRALRARFVLPPGAKRLRIEASDEANGEPGGRYLRVAALRLVRPALDGVGEAGR